MTEQERIIVALDYQRLDEALSLVDRLAGAASFFKVGLELFAGAGPEAVRELKDRGQRVFLDLKFFDIPNTSARASRQAVRLGVDLFNLHLLAGVEVLQAAAAAAREEAAKLGVAPPRLLGVTILTSSQGEAAPVSELVLRLAERARRSGLDGVVASPREAAGLRARFGADFLLVCPGIRPVGAAAADQKRVLSAREARQAGADYLVVGRPISSAPDPRAAFLSLF
ncbi:MAG: Orotidine 5'-phosphate decarboxylase [candidate division TA06 bacterium ADurb.Bin417]|uniref:Orotidine 5'-phosphate decarboxylase n=1 Tax=candidate division TA06 bacterium ADurb.Bin417 TaxID=1852828 RepID=A0A1V5MIE6_UNCT6|nr:MAG: Orotidine 5'-phosphate decarboxylase [candidate division TA06 bacterium ADurb.Bin417]